MLNYIKEVNTLYLYFHFKCFTCCLSSFFTFFSHQSKFLTKMSVRTRKKGYLPKTKVYHVHYWTRTNASVVRQLGDMRLVGWNLCERGVWFHRRLFGTDVRCLWSGSGKSWFPFNINGLKIESFCVIKLY